MSDRFTGPMTIIATQCCYCDHRSRDPADPGCAAFAVIPDVIIRNAADHRSPIAGLDDGGIRFDPRANVPAEVLARLYRTLDALRPSRA